MERVATTAPSTLLVVGDGPPTRPNRTFARPLAPSHTPPVASESVSWGRVLTIFTIPKTFTGDTALIQRNAIESWRQLAHVQIILCGDDPGVADMAAECECEHWPSLRRTNLGTPRLDDAFHAAERLARHDLLCYVNADIILLDGFQSAVQAVSDRAFLIAGRRMNVWISAPLPFERADWDVTLWNWVQREGVYAEAAGSDYFIYRRGTLGEFPPFAVGRPYWDNWMMFRARQRGWPLIDSTPVIRAIHQNHGYGHVPHAIGGMWEGPEADENLRAAGGQVYTLMDATHVLTPTGSTRLVTPAHALRRLRRRLEGLPGWRLVRAVSRVIRRLSARLTRG